MALTPFLHRDEQARIWQRGTRRRFETAPNQHAELVVLLSLSGRATYFLEDSTIQLRAHTALFCGPGQAHFLVSETRDFDMVVAVISGVVVRPPPAHPAFQSPKVQTASQFRILPAQAFEEVSRLAQQLIAADPVAMEAGIGWWLHRLWALSNSGALDGARPVDARVHQAAQELYADPGLPLGELAETLGLTVTRLGQIFRAQTGMTLRDFRTERRFEKFASLRANDPTVNLLRAAFDAGFGNYSSFYRAYRQRFGKNPRQG